ncbi:hypothetical protein Tco_0172873 [Tanacetum coccineum]
MEEYIQLMADKAHKRGQMFDWETTTYGKIYEDIDYFIDFKTDFPTIFYKDALTHEPKVSSEPTLLADGDVEEVGDLSLESMKDEEVATVDGVFEGEFGALGDKTWFGSGSFGGCHGGKDSRGYVKGSQKAERNSKSCELDG